jgi:deazaflavin-dependent oxidoreductase (nitroreductase family)
MPADFFAAMLASEYLDELTVRMGPSLSSQPQTSQVYALSQPVEKRIFPAMNLKNGSTLVANLTTIGRKTGQPRTVELRFLYFNRNFYATSSKVEGKHWCQNMIRNPVVEIAAKGEKLSCTARQVTDEALRQRILTLRDSPPQLNRVVFEITPDQ